MKVPNRPFIARDSRMLRLYLHGQPQIHPCTACAPSQDQFDCIHDGQRGRCLWCVGTGNSCSLGSTKAWTTEEILRTKPVRGYAWETASDSTDEPSKPVLPITNRQTASAMHAASAVFHQAEMASAKVSGTSKESQVNTSIPAEAQREDGDESLYKRKISIIVIQNQIAQAFPDGLPKKEELLLAVQQLYEGTKVET